MKLHFTADPGHGWLHVKRAVALDVMGIDFVRLSSCSYQRGKTLYLEEDCDALLFMNCARARGLEIDVVYNHTDRSAPIRSYESLTHYVYS
jgi:hypothetical protein